MYIFEFTKTPKSSEHWKASWQNKDKDHEAIELRKSFSVPNHDSCNVLIIIGLNGWIKHNEVPFDNSTGWYADTSNLNVRISMNGALKGDWNVLQEIIQVIAEAKEFLELPKGEERDALIALTY